MKHLILIKTVDKKSISMIHPLDSTRCIYFCSCGTHSQKVTRNNLFRSKQNGTKNLKLNKCDFGWKDVKTILLRYEKRFKENKYKRTDIVRQTISLGSLTMMNATYAKQPFTSKTISDILSYLSIRCNVKYTKENVYK